MYCENVPFVGTFADTNALSLYGFGVPTAKTCKKKKNPKKLISIAKHNICFFCFLNF